MTTLQSLSSVYKGPVTRPATLYLPASISAKPNTLLSPRFSSQHEAQKPETVLETIIHWVRNTIKWAAEKALRYWDNLATMATWGLAKFSHKAFPPDIKRLQADLKPMLGSAPSGFPTPLIRARLLKTGNEDAFAPFEVLQQKYRDPMSAEQLIGDYVTTESEAFLTSHLTTLESQIYRPGFKMQTSHTLLKALTVGVEDANAIVRRRMKQHFYGKDNHGIHDRLYNLILGIPKVTLHEHYRGCAPLALVRAKAIQDVHPKAYHSTNALEEYYRVDRVFTADKKPLPVERNLNNYRIAIDRIAPAIYSDDTAYLGAYMYTLRAGLENVRYFEYRLNPLSKDVRDPIRYIRAIQQGLDDAKAFLATSMGRKVDSNLIISADRQPKPGMCLTTPADAPYDGRVKLALDILNVAIEARKKGLRVTGFDIQGDELNYAITDFKPVADALKAYNRRVEPSMRIGATIHAGETPMSGLISHPKLPLTGEESVREAINLFYDAGYTPVRIGHGIRASLNKDLIESAVQKDIGFEQCPRSNVQTKAVEYYWDLPTLSMMRDYGLKVSISCDNRTVSKTNPCNELVKLSHHLKARHEDRKQFQLNGIDTAFIFDPLQKAAIRNDMLAEYTAIETSTEHQPVIALEKNPLAFNNLLNNNPVPELSQRA